MACLFLISFCELDYTLSVDCFQEFLGTDIYNDTLQNKKSECLYEHSDWCARLDSNQRPTESELSGRQGRNPGFMRVSGTSHKISTDLQKPWRPLALLGSHGFSGFWKIVVKQ